jgi:hypothetical protein
LNKAYPKDNFTTPFIDQIIDECVGCKAFSFMDGFSGYNQIQIKPEDQQKMTFICPFITEISSAHGDKNSASSKQE